MSTSTGSSTSSCEIDNDTLYGIVGGAILALGTYAIYDIFTTDKTPHRSKQSSESSKKEKMIIEKGKSFDKQHTDNSVSNSSCNNDAPNPSLEAMSLIQEIYDRVIDQGGFVRGSQYFPHTLEKKLKACDAGLISELKTILKNKGLSICGNDLKVTNENLFEAFRQERYGTTIDKVVDCLLSKAKDVTITHHVKTGRVGIPYTITQNKCYTEFPYIRTAVNKEMAENGYLVTGKFGVYIYLHPDTYLDTYTFSSNEITSFDDILSCQKAPVETHANFVLEYALKEAKRNPQSGQIHVCSWIKGSSNGGECIFHQYMSDPCVSRLVNGYLYKKGFEIIHKHQKASGYWDDDNVPSRATYHLKRLE